MSESAAHLRLVDGPLFDRETGTPAEHAPNYSSALQLLEQVVVEIRMLERDLAGKRLRIATLEADREAAVMNDPLRPEVEFLHTVWKRACNRRRPLDWGDRERISRAISGRGFARCCQAIAGAAYDPNRSKPRKNGKRTRYDDLELIFREYARVDDFAERLPDSWSLDVPKLAELGGVSVAWLEERLK